MRPSVHLLPALIAAAPLLAQAPIPATPAGQKLNAWVENFNAGDAARIVKYAKENYAPEFLKEIPAEQCAQMDTGAHGQVGELSIHSVELKDAQNLKAILTNKDQSMWVELSFGVSPEAPHLVTMIGIRPTRKPTVAKVESQPKAAVSSTFPDTIAGRKAKTWLENYNSGDAARIALFTKENASPKRLERKPAEKDGEEWTGIHAELGALSVYSVESPSEFEVQALVCNKDQSQWLTFIFKVGSAAPHYVSAIGLRPAERPAAMKLERLPDAALAQDVDTFLQKRTAEDKFAGAVLIAKNGQPFFTKAYGMADRDKKVANGVDTKFAIGSMNKMITSVAIAQLVQAGKLQFTDTLAKVLPDYPNKEAAAKITVHHLLTHTSGLGDVFTEAWEKKKDTVRTVQDWFPFFVNKPLAFEPGGKHEYSNAGFVVLGAIIEKVSGQDYYTYVRKHIYQPLGMKDSDSYAKSDVVAKMAVGYMRGEKPTDPKRDNVSTRPFRGFPAGGGYSTVGDLLKFAEGLRGFKLLNREFTERITTKKVEMAPQIGYGYGFVDACQGDLHTVGHQGGAPGMNGMLSIYWESGYTVVVLANIDAPAASAIAEYIHERIQAK